MDNRLDDLEKRVSALEQGVITKKPKREKREPTQKQKDHHLRFKTAYAKWSPIFKKENPKIKSSEIFKKVHEKLKESP